MGDDAEYYMEQQEEEARFNEARDFASPSHYEKPLLCWVDGIECEDEIWNWKPMDRILGVFSQLHKDRQIGSDSFLVSSVPIEDDEEYWNNEYDSSLEADGLRNSKFVNELEFYIANTEADATYEVIVLSRSDADQLKAEVVRQKSSAKTLKEKMLVEMLEEMVSVIDADSQRKTFVFARRL